MLKQQLPLLAAKGIRVIPVSTLLNEPVVRMAEQSSPTPEALVLNQHLGQPQKNWLFDRGPPQLESLSNAGIELRRART